MIFTIVQAFVVTLQLVALLRKPHTNPRAPPRGVTLKTADVPELHDTRKNPDFPHSSLKWRMEEFDPTATEALGSKVFEECTTCGTRWFDQRTRHKPPLRK